MNIILFLMAFIPLSILMLPIITAEKRLDVKQSLTLVQVGLLIMQLLALALYIKAQTN